MIVKTRPQVEVAKVTNQQEYEKHISIVEKGWEENGWTLENVDRKDARRYLIYDKNESKEPFATFEVIPYIPEFNTADKTSVEDVFSFKNVEQLKKENYENVFELDKLTIIKENRKPENLALVLMAILTVADRLNAKYLAVLIKPSLFRVLSKSFNVPIEKVGENIFYYSWLTPAVINIELSKNPMNQSMKSLFANYDEERIYIK